MTSIPAKDRLFSRSDDLLLHYVTPEAVFSPLTITIMFINDI